ncbi:MAG TPA: carboxypeptidase regulatory-like domain-containing protein [Chitinophagaceae bacterium]|nr:carboxypeptidase regulatory-like domain-containing protein [Chitinophagaceae bacterium]
MLKKISGFLTFLLALSISTTMQAQVTTSSINGTVTDTKGETLSGATVTAVHQPSGTKYATISKKGGVFNLPGLRSGGPYTVTINFVGYKPQVTENITLTLGDAYNINAEMSTTITDLAAVTITGSRRRSSADKNGATTNINPRMLATLPTITRSITDFTRITPQSNGTSFAGRDNRLNNVTVDGANLNNNFGLSSDLLPGGGNPIALDAFSEISVNISPYDVKQSGFTGAGVSAITKSGTNTFHGSVYGSYRNQSYNGTNVAGTKLPSPAKTSNKIYGATFGGPIIKNKLFFFLSGEIEKADQPGVTFSPNGGSKNGTVSNVPIDSMKKLSSYLNSKYGFDPGAYDNYPNFASDNYKVLGKLDWNISNSHKLTLKYSDFRNTGYSIASQSGGINGASGQAGIVTYQSSRFGLNALGFNNSNYKTIDKVRSGSFELNSNFHGKFANQLLATITKISSIKDHDGDVFPFADILGQTAGSRNNYLSFGNEPFNGNNNQVINDVYTVTDNFSYFTGKHTVTAGANYEYQRVGNMFMPGSQGYYVYGSLDDFTNNRAPKLFSINYSLVPDQDAVFSANLKVGQLGLYVQDEVNINPRFKLTYGLRIDRPIYPEQPLENPAITALPLYDKNGNVTNYNDGKWPTPKWLFSPRAGFRWDVEGDKTMIVRGGTGIFTGRIPFVYLTNAPSTSGMYTFGALVTSNLQNFLFDKDPHAYNPFYKAGLDPAIFPKTAGTVAPSGGFAVIDPNFKFPQIWRTNFAIEKQLGNGWNLTLEALYTKDLNNAVMRNANQKATDTVVNVGPGDVRGRFSTNSNTLRRLNAGIANAVVLENTGKGGSIALTALVTKNFSHGFYGSLAYTYTYASEVTANPGSQAASVWSANPTSGTQNDQQVSYSGFSVPHRIVATLSYRVEYLKHLASTFTFFYDGSSQGTYSYIYNGDINQDGNSADLMYIPKDPSEIKFVNLPASGTTPAFTAQQQSDAFFQLVSKDHYLSHHMGQTSERNAARYPFYHRVDFNFQQELFTNIGKNRNSLIFNASVVNFLNLLNHNWGIRKLLIVNNPLKLVNPVVNGVPTYQMSTFNNDLIRQPYINVSSTSTTWGIQLGVKYLF